MANHACTSPYMPSSRRETCGMRQLVFRPLVDPRQCASSWMWQQRLCEPVEVAVVDVAAEAQYVVANFSVTTTQTLAAAPDTSAKAP